MPEEDIETAELKESVEASVERAFAESQKDRWTTYLSLSTAIIAVFAAVASLESGANSNDAILEKNDAVLDQSRASDQWALYPAKNTRATIANEFALSTNGDLAKRFEDEARRIRAEEAPLERTARLHEHAVEEHSLHADHLLARHHRFAVAVTLVQIAVALCAIAALVRKKRLWVVALAASTVGFVLFAAGFVAPT